MICRNQHQPCLAPTSNPEPDENHQDLRCFPLHTPPVICEICRHPIIKPQLASPPSFQCSFLHHLAPRESTYGRVLRTGLVCTTSFKVRFIHVSHVTRCPFSVSPFLSSTSIGWPCAAVKRPRGSCAFFISWYSSGCEVSKGDAIGFQRDERGDAPLWMLGELFNVYCDGVLVHRNMR